MRRTLALVVLLLALTIAACDGGDGNPSPTPTTTSTLPAATATAPPGPPAANGYQLVPAVPAATFPQMLGLAIIPGSEDEAVLISQTGELRRISLEGADDPFFFGDVSQLLISDPALEEGLLGIAFSPDYESDGLLYLYYSAGNPRRTVLSRFQVTNNVLDLVSEQVLLEVEQPFPNHKGGQLAFGTDGMLYVALGDGGSAYDPMLNGQDLSDLLGNILRIDVSGGGPAYTVPPDNPFLDTPGAAPEVYAYGLRNPWRFSFDLETGDLWAGDVGQDRWEEVDRVVAGGNYGWRIMEGNECLRLQSSTNMGECDRTGLSVPRAVYGRADGCSVTGGYVYRGESMPELDGYYIYGDFCTGNLWAVDTSNDTSPAILIAATGARISSFTQLPNGEILALTYDEAIFRLARAT